MSPKIQKIGQFAPSFRQPEYQGVFGWGFDQNGYRIVMYGSKETDTEWTRNQIAQIMHKPRRPRIKEAPAEGTTKGERRQIQRNKDFVSALYNEDNERRDHGPAHVHAIHLHTKKEAAFDLVERYDGQSFARFSRYIGNSESFSPNQIAEIEELILPYTNQFIQFWREAYRDVGTSRYVTRISRIGKHDIEHVPYKSKQNGHCEIWLEIHEDNGQVTRIPPPEDTLPATHGDRLVNRKKITGNDSSIWHFL